MKVKFVSLFVVSLFTFNIISSEQKPQESVSNMIGNIESKSALSKSKEAYDNANKAYLRAAINTRGYADLGELKKEQIKARDHYLKEFELSKRVRLDLTKKVKNKIEDAENNVELFEELYAKTKLLNWNPQNPDNIEVPDDVLQNYNKAINKLAELKAPRNPSIQEIIKQISKERVEYLLKQGLKKPLNKTKLIEEINNINNDIKGESSGDEAEEIFKDLTYKLEWNRPLNDRSLPLSKRPSEFRPKLKELQRKSQEKIKRERNLKKVREGSH
ncbi:MAG: hypothetical protein P4L22_03970 [Candidatus Babeliales bacterium]|nr:hypothetical protein [Candidatus Babeliales bacterium]